MKANELSPNALTRRPRARDERPPQVVAGRNALNRVAADANTSGAADYFHPKFLLRGLWQHLLVALTLGTVVGVCGAFAAWTFTPAPFEAKSMIQMRPETPRILFHTGDQRHDPDYMRNQTQLILSDLVVKKALVRPGVEDANLFQGVEHPRNWVRKNLRAVVLSPEIMEIRLAGEDARGLAMVVNAVQEAYFDEVYNVEKESRSRRLEELKRIQEVKEDEIRGMRDTIKKISEVVGSSADPGANSVQLQNTWASMNEMRSQWMAKYIELMRERALFKAMQDDPNGKPRALGDAVLNSLVSAEPEVERLESQLASKQRLLADTERLVTKQDHPLILEYRQQVATLTKTLAETKARLRPRIEKKIQEDMLARSEITLQDRQFSIELLEKEEERLKQEFESLQKEAKSLGATSFELEDKKGEIESLDELTSVIENEIRAVEVELSAPPRVKLLQDAEVPTQRDTKKKYMATLGAGAGGFALVCFLIALAEARLRRVLSVQDVAPKVRVMGQVPMIPAWVSRSTRAAKSRRGRFWHDMLTESIDAARTMLVHEAEQEDLRIIMVVSAMPSEGKTTLSCHLASSLARAGRRVVLVDCDLRRPRVHQVFGVSNKVGFCEVLLGKAELDEAIQAETPGCPAILTAGQFSPMVSPLLGVDATDQVFQLLKERFEFVIVDTSPVMIVHDTLVVAKHVDAAVMAIRRNISRQPKVAAVVDRLQALEVPVLGTVAIGLYSDSQDYGSSYYRGYAKYYTERPRRTATK